MAEDGFRLPLCEEADPTLDVRYPGDLTKRFPGFTVHHDLEKVTVLPYAAPPDPYAHCNDYGEYFGKCNASCGSSSHTLSQRAQNQLDPFLLPGLSATASMALVETFSLATDESMLSRVKQTLASRGTSSNDAEEKKGRKTQPGLLNCPNSLTLQFLYVVDVPFQHLVETQLDGATEEEVEEPNGRGAVKKLQIQLLKQHLLTKQLGPTVKCIMGLAWDVTAAGVDLASPDDPANEARALRRNFLVSESERSLVAKLKTNAERGWGPITQLVHRAAGGTDDSGTEDDDDDDSGSQDEHQIEQWQQTRHTSYSMLQRNMKRPREVALPSRPTSSHQKVSGPTDNLCFIPLVSDVLASMPMTSDQVGSCCSLDRPGLRAEIADAAKKPLIVMGLPQFGTANTKPLEIIPFCRFDFRSELPLTAITHPVTVAKNRSTNTTSRLKEAVTHSTVAYIVGLPSAGITFPTHVDIGGVRLRVLFLPFGGVSEPSVMPRAPLFNDYLVTTSWALLHEAVVTRKMRDLITELRVRSNSPVMQAALATETAVISSRTEHEMMLSTLRTEEAIGLREEFCCRMQHFKHGNAARSGLTYEDAESVITAFKSVLTTHLFTGTSGHRKGPCGHRMHYGSRSAAGSFSEKALREAVCYILEVIAKRSIWKDHPAALEGESAVERAKLVKDLVLTIPPVIVSRLAQLLPIYDASLSQQDVSNLISLLCFIADVA